MRLLTKRVGRFTAEVSEVAFRGGFLVDHTQPRDRVMIALEEVGDRVQARDSPRGPRTAVDAPHRMYVAPAGAPFWTFSEAPLFLRYLSLDYALADLDGLAEAPRPPTSPRFAFFEPRLLALARRFETECAAREPTDPLLADELAVGLLVGLGGGSHAPPRQPYQGGLTPRQARIVVDYLESQLAGPVETSDLARLAGLSVSHFHRAFRVSTGLPPYAWLTQLRIRRARELMLRTGKPLAEIALETGFSDQPHFTRVFSREMGASPAAWRRAVRR